MASAGVGLFLSSLRRAFSGGIFIELRSLFAILRGCAQHQSFRSLSDLPGRADSKVALHLFDRRGRPSSKEGQDRFSFHTHDLAADNGEIRDVNTTCGLRKASEMSKLHGRS